MSESDDMEVLEQAVESPSLRDHDALLNAVAWMTRHHRRERSVPYLVAGMNLTGELAPDQAVQILRQEGYSAGLIQRGLGGVQPEMLPAVALLKNRDACIIKSKLSNDKGFEVILPGPTHQTLRAAQTELELEYTGFLLLVEPKVEPRVPTQTTLKPQRRFSEIMLNWMTFQRSQ